MSALIALALLPALLLTAGIVLRAASGRFRDGASTLIDAVDAALPQTQCGQCGYPGCRPYAEALLAGAPLDLCPPGGAHTQAALVRLLGREPGRRLENVAPLRAVIDEDRCIGCYLCIEACPVDAIVGARQWLHTVIEDRCTGCELCVAPCPVDCIDMVAAEAAAAPIAAEAPDTDGACIRCGRCREVCPEALLPDQLWWASRADANAAADEAALAACIECGLCNPVCPSNLDLLGTFVSARAQRAAVATLEQEAERARSLFEEREARLARAAADTAARRSRRLRTRERPW